MGDGDESKLSEEDKTLMREEFEAGLLEAGLQIERDKEVRINLCSALTVIVFTPAARHLCLRSVPK